MHLPCNQITEDFAVAQLPGRAFLPVMTAAREPTVRVFKNLHSGKFTVVTPGDCPVVPWFQLSYPQITQID
jgi:hypothetical protein